MPLPGSLDDQYIQALRDIAKAVRENTQAITEYTELFKQTLQEPPETSKLKKMPSRDNPFDTPEDDDFFPRGPKVPM